MTILTKRIAPLVPSPYPGENANSQEPSTPTKRLVGMPLTGVGLAVTPTTTVAASPNSDKKAHTPPTQDPCWILFCVDLPKRDIGKWWLTAGLVVGVEGRWVHALQF